MKKLNYIQPNAKTLIVSNENLMQFVVSGSEADGDFDFAKENDIEEEALPNPKSVWEE
jgi:hypothetical protein